MDSGLGSDEDRSRGRTKEQKQLRNQQLLSGCFIDAASLSDDSDQQRRDERRQGALIFQNSIPQFSMLQMPSESIYTDPPDTPFNSIVQIDGDDEQHHQEHEHDTTKTPLGFYVDLTDIPDEPPPKTPANTSKKNIFSMVIDFEGPKKEKPIKLSSSLITYKKKNKQLSLTATCNGNGNGSLSSSVSSISSMAGPSQQIDDEVKEKDSNEEGNASMSSKSSSSGENIIILEKDEKKLKEENINHVNPCKGDEQEVGETNHSPPIKEKEENQQSVPQFVKLSDLECQKPRLDLPFVPRMSKSIPESSWVECPLLMSRSAGYRSAPHPMEPESGDLSDSGSATDTSVSQPRKSVQRLGTDLLRMFLEEIGPDVAVEVDGHRLKAHKCILASRCQYFAALLSGNWLEASGNVISLQGFSYESVYFALCHIYSGASHVPDSISLVELASLADMLGLEGLKEVVEHALKQRHCHNFHKPCAGCCTGVLEVLPLSAAYGLDDLYRKCLQWITQNFARVWPSRAFASLPRDLREKCYQQHIIHMTNDKVIETIITCDKIVGTIPTLKWADPVLQLLAQLSHACRFYLRQHFAGVLASSSFLALDSGLGWSVVQVEDLLVSAANQLSVEQACKSYARICKMLEQSWSRPFNDLLYRIQKQLEQCLILQSDNLNRSNAWLRLDSALRCRIKCLKPSINEPVSRLPRKKKTTLQSTNKLNQNSTRTLSSSESSRNSSPGMNQNQSRTNNGGIPLRQSLLLAAHLPQVASSPSTRRRSTLTQPTASSVAKSVPNKRPKNNPVQPPPPELTKYKSSSVSKEKPNIKKPQQQSASNPTTRTSSGSNIKKPNTLINKKPISRSSSPLKAEGSTGSSPRRFDSRITSPVKAELRASSPKKVNRVNSTRKVTQSKSDTTTTSANNNNVKPAPTMQRSSTFLKEEPTILKKVK